MVWPASAGNRGPGKSGAQMASPFPTSALHRFIGLGINRCYNSAVIQHWLMVSIEIDVNLSGLSCVNSKLQQERSWLLPLIR